MDSVKKVLELSGFGKLNPVQELAVKSGLLKGKSLVVAAPTASGKTMIAEIAALEAIKSGKKVAYIVPLKALASEKYEEFRERYGPLGIKVGMSVGDLDSSDPWLASYDLTIFTSEKLDSLLRHGLPWAEQIGLVVADEIHLLNDPGRGPTLELVLTRLRQVADPIILGLSATISNYQELADWLGAEAVKSDYRPVKLYQGVCFDGEARFMPRRSFRVRDIPITQLSEQTLKRGKQALIFINTRRGAESSAEKLGRLLSDGLKPDEKKKLLELSGRIARALGHPTKQCRRLASCIENGVSFHHAGLVNKQRSMIEKAFRAGIIKLICATPTLAMGLNLPAWRIIIRDLKRFSSFRGMDYIPVLEIQQMCIPGDEKITLANGDEIKIKDIFHKKRTECVLTYNIDKKCYEPQRILKKHIRKSSVFVRIKTNSGNSIKSTPEHPFLVKEGEKLLWKEVSRIKEGDTVCLFRKKRSNDINFFELLPKKNIYVKGLGQMLASAKKRMSLSDSVLAEKLEVSEGMIYHYKKDIKSMPIGAAIKLCRMLGKKPYRHIKKVKTSCGSVFNLPEKITEDFMWLVGMIMTDGNIQKTIDKRTNSVYHKIRVFNKNIAIINKSKKIMEKLGLRPCLWKVHNCFVLEAGSTFLAKMLNKSFGIPFGQKSKKTRISPLIFNLRTNQIAAFISGIFDGDGSFQMTKRKTGYSYRILFATSSKRFAHDLKNLLKYLFVESKIVSRKAKKTIIRGEIANFSADSYFILSQKKADMINFFTFVKPVKTNVKIPEYSKYHNIDTHFNKNAPLVWENVAEVRRICLKKAIEVFNLTMPENENFISSNFIVHNCGRAGRPQFDKEGEAILLPKNSAEAKYAWDNYIKGEPEKIQSKLGVEPVLRMHVLALIASGATSTRKELMDFFSRTFYAHQYQDLQDLEKILNRVLELLEGFRFITSGTGKEESAGDREEKGLFKPASSLLKREDKELRPTRIGRRVSELYIDPLTANHLIKSLGRAKSQGLSHLAVLHTISNTIEMKPLLNLRKKDFESIEEMLAQAEPELLEKPPSQWDLEYDDFLRSLKTSLMFRSWTQETGEDNLLENFNVTPGELRARLDNADWLLYSLQELAYLLGHPDLLKDIRKSRLRVKYGVRRELLPLVRLRKIGRARARIMYNSGVKGLKELRKIPLQSLERLIGEKTARDVKAQLGGSA